MNFIISIFLFNNRVEGAIAISYNSSIICGIFKNSTHYCNVRFFSLVSLYKLL